MRGRISRCAAGLLFAALLGCALQVTPTPTTAPVVAQGLASDDLLFTVDVYDDTGTLAGAEVVPYDSGGLTLTNPPAERVAPIEGEDRALHVVWIALPCQDRPSIQLRSGDRLELTLNKGPQREGVCPFISDFFAVRLDFDSPVSADVELRVTPQE